MQGFDDQMEEIIESFIVESNELIDKLGQDLLLLEKDGKDAELHNTIFRAVHTVKGTSSFLGFDQMTNLAHNYEDVLNKIRKKELVVSGDVMDIMFEAYDFMKILLERIEKKDNTPVVLDDIIHKLTTVQIPGTGVSDKNEARIEHDVKQEKEVREEIKSQPEHEEPTSPDDKTNSTGVRAVDNTIRVDVGRLDGIMNLVGELVLGRNRLSQISDQMKQYQEGTSIEKELTGTFSQLDFITTELQMAVMKARMVPMSKAFNKLPRLIRDLCRESGKKIELNIVGAENELDKSIIEELNDPLVHILRNAADHGIESPADRIAAGKPEAGSVTIQTRREGNYMAITIADDGRGLDPEKLKAKAIQRNLITGDQARDMSNPDACNLIFAPGFSTAEKVTNVSGRGVGMDVVRTNVQKLKGIIEINSEAGKGTTFTIKLPLTLAIIQGLLAQVQNEIFSIPLNSVLEVVRIEKSNIQTIRGKEVIKLRDTILPLVCLSSVFNIPPNGTKRNRIYIVVIGLAEKRIGVVVDTLLGQKEVVIKSLGEYLGTIPGIAGSTILGDGRVIMILDIAPFMKLCGEA
jgi:two-component system, chemotaxis family, sensor kinase CheA